MRRPLFRTLLAVALCGLVAGVAPGPAAAAPADEDIVAKLRQVPGLTVVSEEPVPPPYRYFRLTFRQPADHRNPGRGSFEQRLTLLHRDERAPMVMHTTGYNLPAKPFRSEPTTLVDGNQVSIEYRFFTPSRPEPADWSTLDIWQAATDQHRIVAALRGIYDRRWLSTGQSKGGMTAVYHRRFYPADVDASVPYVAPNDVDNDHDAYGGFLDRVGSDPACRDSLVGFQRETLRRRDEVQAIARGEAAARGYTFGNVGSLDRAWELAVSDSYWSFWQYSLQQDCPRVPPAGTPASELHAFLDATAGALSYADQELERYVPYYYQAGTQLGWPSGVEEHIEDLLRYPGENMPRTMVPRQIPMRFQPGAMRDIDRWVRASGERMLFVYGQNDPWGAEPFVPNPRGDSYSYTAPGANHGANVSQLAYPDATAAAATIRRWAGVPASAAPHLRHNPEIDTSPIMLERPPR